MEQHEHLTDAQIEHYGEPTTGAGPDRNQQIEAQLLEAHLADCPGCRARVLAFHRARFSPASTAQSVSTAQSATNSEANPAADSGANSMTDSCPSADRRPLHRPDYPAPDCPNSDCPSEDALRSLAAGLTPPDQATSLIQHAAQCTHCGPILRMYTEDFSDDLTLADQVLLAHLKSSSPEWQEQAAREMLQQASSPEPFKAAAVAPGTDSAPEPRPPAPPRSGHWKKLLNVPWKWIMVPATASVAIIAVGLWYLNRDTPEETEKYLADAYKGNRTTEMRWPGAKWGERAETLGSVHGKKPSSLLEADAVIQRQTPETLSKKEWLNVRAQKEILSGIGIPALQQLIDDLTKATQSQPTSQSLLLDLAIANFRMGEITQDIRYYKESKAILDKMLATSSSPSSAALFDRAVVNQRLLDSAVGERRLQLRNSAIADLQECLNREKDQQWREEIQQKIQDWKAFSDQ